MIALASIVHQHWHAVERDLIALGLDEAFDEGRLPVGKLASVVFAAPPGSAVRHSVDEGWSMEAHLLATMTEQDAGLMRIGGRYPRPGVEVKEPEPMPVDNNPMDHFGNYRLTAMPIDELKSRLRTQHKAIAQKNAPEESSSGALLSEDPVVAVEAMRHELYPFDELAEEVRTDG